MAVRFAVLGDLHLVDASLPRPNATESQRQALARRARYREEIWPGLLAEVRAAAPDFVVQTGDLLDGGVTSEAEAIAEARGVLAELGSLGVPVWLTQGNHDVNAEPTTRKVWDAVQRAHLEGQLGRPLESAYYSFDFPGGRFFILDYRDTRAAQIAWLQQELTGGACTSGGSRRAFLAMHAPLHPVARPFFSEPGLTATVVEAIGGRAVDALFCGHTHNPCVTLHPWGARRLLQVKTAAVGDPMLEPVPLLSVRTPLQAGGPPEVLWGYLEDTAPGWNLVTMEEETVTVEWRLIGRGTRDWVRWREAGTIDALEAPAPVMPGLSAADIPRIQSGRVYLAFWNSKDPEKEVRLNGVPIGHAPLCDWFSPHRFVPIPDAALSAIRRMNEVTIANPRGEVFVVGGAYVEVTLDDGQVVRSTPSDFLIATGPNWDAWNEPTLLHVPPGETVSLRALRFRS